jgi:hypothetical protein
VFLVPSPYFFFVCLDLESFDEGPEDANQTLDWLPSLWHLLSDRASRLVKVLKGEPEDDLETAVVDCSGVNSAKSPPTFVEMGMLCKNSQSEKNTPQQISLSLTRFPFLGLGLAGNS